VSRPICTTVVFAVILVSLLGTADAFVAAEQSVPLARETSMHGDRTQSAIVTLPRQTRFSQAFPDSPSVSIRGGGRFAGIVLRSLTAR
jgi:hypothetical protein